VSNKRDQIKMTDEEVLAFLDEQVVVTCASMGPSGRPHLMPLWYVVHEGTIWAWTFAKSQKAKNFERDPRATLQVEAGGTNYSELQGVMIEADVVLHRDVEVIKDMGAKLLARYSGGETSDELRQAAGVQAAKRVAMEFSETRRVTWDHRKLGGVY
jgi:nitroimidazol reductase NimA-like FMN-containing flavoprotein (pyridoxamine 5'-phosphate oxidase superfamily)